jgi:hypothetical protein
MNSGGSPAFPAPRSKSSWRMCRVTCLCLRPRVSVRARVAGRDLHGLDAGVGQDCVERLGALPCPVADQVPEVRSAVTQVHQQVADLLCGPRPVRVRGDTEDVHVPGADLDHDMQYRRCRVTMQSTWKKPAASMVTACTCRNFRHVVSVSRLGAGGIFSALRIRRIVDALTPWPTFSSSPWILLQPQPLFSVASRSMSAATSALAGGRPKRCG